MATENIRKRAKDEQAQLEEGFDEAEKEKTSKTAEIEVLGKTFTVQRAMPGWVTFFLGKYGVGEDKEVPPEKYLSFLVRVCGDEISDHIIENAPNDMDTEELTKETLNKIQALWEGDAKKKK